MTFVRSGVTVLPPVVAPPLGVGSNSSRLNFPHVANNGSLPLQP